MIVQVCVGSSCHIKGSQEIVELLQNAVSRCGYDLDVTLAGSFCMGKCNRHGITIRVNDEIVTQITRENFQSFWTDYIVKGVEAERAG